MNAGTLNSKNEFGTNHLCRLETSSSVWEKEKERLRAEKIKSKTESDLKQFITVMSNVNVKRINPSPVSNQDMHSRYKNQRKRVTTDEEYREEGVITKKKRRMNSHSTPNNTHRVGDSEMMKDKDLVSPIPQPGMDAHHQELTSESYESCGDVDGAIAPARLYTNLSDDLRIMRLDELNSGIDDSTRELLIGFLCLEDAAIRRGIIEKKPTSNIHLEWLDVEGLAERLLKISTLMNGPVLKKCLPGKRIISETILMME